MKKIADTDTAAVTLQYFSFPGTPEYPSITIEAENREEAETLHADFLKSLKKKNDEE